MVAEFIQKLTPSQPTHTHEKENISGDPEKHHRIFSHLSIRDLPGKEKNEIAETIIDGLNTGVEYRSQMLLSAVIATLGLLIDSTPVVIGAMLIAPIMRPIQGMAFATITGSHSLFIRSLGLLISSVGASAVVAALITLCIPFAQPTAEILTRTQPTLIDLFIALASGVIAFLGLGHKKITASLAGVAMAAALVPPLAVTGIGMAFRDTSIARGSFLLFATNIIAIVLVGVVTLILFGFMPNAKKNYRKSISRVGSIILLLVLLCVPLFQSFVNITQDIKTNNIIKSYTQEYIQTIDPRIKISSVNYKSSLKSEKETIDVMLQLQAPQTTSITQNQKVELTQLLAQELQKSVNLHFTIIPIISIQKPLQDSAPSLKESLDEVVSDYIDEDNPHIKLLSSVYIDTSHTYLLTLYAPADTDTSRFQQDLGKVLDKNQIKIAEVVYDRRQPKPFPTQKQQTESDAIIAEVHQSLKSILADKVVIQNISFEKKSKKLSIDLVSYVSPDDTNDIISDRYTSDQFSDQLKKINIEFAILYKEKITIIPSENDLSSSYVSDE